MSDPVGLQRDLLLAAFAAPSQALPAWARWQSASGWERHLDFESYLLLPRVYHNLGGRGVDDALYTRLKGVVKRNWAANAATLAVIARIAEILQTKGIASELLPPCALLLSDRSAALAAGTPIAYRIARGDAPNVIALLRDAGWRCIADGVPRWSLPGYIAAVDRIELRDAGETALDLRWTGPLDRADGDSAFRELRGCTIRMPGARSGVGLLLDDAGAGSELGRLSRALLLLEKAPDAGGWRHLTLWLQQRGSPFLDTVSVLSPAVATPDDSVPESQADSVEARGNAATEDHNLTFIGRLATPWRTYCNALGEQTSLPQALQCLPGYLTGKWRLRHAGELLPAVYRSLRYHWRQRRARR